MNTLGEIFNNLRTSQDMSLEEIASKTNLHRTAIARIEKGEREPTVRSAMKIAEALNSNLGTLIFDQQLEPRDANPDFIINSELIEKNGITRDNLLEAINQLYRILTIIDFMLTEFQSPPLASLAELANFSSIAGNILGGSLAAFSHDRFERNRPHQYPDLISKSSEYPDFEIKVALEKNLPKGHLPKAGYYMTFRYVLTDDEGAYTVGRSNRGTNLEIWEVKYGYLSEDDFSISNTSGDSGKTATFKTPILNKMPLVYFNPDACPYKAKNNWNGTNYPGYN